MKTVKYLGISLTVLLSLGMISQVSSYTSAQVTSDASVHVVSQEEKALIGIVVDEVYKELSEDGTFLIPFTIKNNMNRPITKMDVDNLGDITIKDANAKNEKKISNPSNLIVRPGEQKDLLFECTGNISTDITFIFQWEGGSAKIQKSLDYDAPKGNDIEEDQEEDEQKEDVEDVSKEKDIVQDMILPSKDTDQVEGSLEDEKIKDDEKQPKPNESNDIQRELDEMEETKDWKKSQETEDAEEKSLEFDEKSETESKDTKE